ncbi:hypothetical protein [Microbacterium sp. GXS0129]|uniref:rolling circle replication-associated protein n=1 Tax=Microbacterium sp. GXS0129 TaxID=3377836 RepID=UPI00383B71E8
MATTCVHGNVIINPYTNRKVYVPCGTCDACLLSKTTRNEMRVFAAQSVYKYTYFLTPTYNAKTVPRYRIKAYLPLSELRQRQQNLAEDPNYYSTHSHVYIAIPCTRESVYRTVTMFPRNPRLRKDVLIPVSGISKCLPERWMFMATGKYVSEYCDKTDLRYSKNRKTGERYVRYPEYANTYPYVNWNDLTLFIKRIRKAIFKRLGYYAKIHYYVVAEYGPTTFRPHFHIILFFNEDEVAQNFGRIVNPCWRLGNLDWSASRGNAESYVAGYVNSFSSVPYHLRENAAVRSRGRFSVGCGNEFFDSEKSRALQGDFSLYINGKDVVHNGKLRTLYPWRSCIDSVFFRFAARDGVSWNELYSVVQSVRNVFRRPAFRGLSPSATVKKLYKHIYEELTPTERERYLEEDVHLREISWFLHLPFDQWHSEEFQDSFFSRWYNLFRHTHNWLAAIYKYNNSNFVRFVNLIPYYLKLSINFFKNYDYEGLRHSFEACESSQVDSAYIFIRQTEEENTRFLSTPEGIASQSRLKKLMYDATKHRELNDRNIKFIQYGTL